MGYTRRRILSARDLSKPLRRKSDIMPEQDLPEQPAPAQDHRDITRIVIDGKEIVLIGTAHISQRSVDVVRQVIRDEEPDTVCVELDDQRFKALTEQTNWDELNLKEIIKSGQTTFLIARLALTAFQKRMSLHTGVKPGAEMLAAIEVAQGQGAELVMADRNIRITLLRAWRKTPFMKRAGVGGLLVAGLFQRSEVSEEDLEELREGHNIAQVLDELGDAMPSVKRVLVDERDTFMAHAIRKAPGQKIVAVVGAAHKAGILLNFERDIETPEIEEIERIPEVPSWTKILPWILPLIVIGVFAWGAFNADTEQLKQAALAWVLANGILAALGAAIALAHPLTILVAFIAAPLTSLNPAIGAGMVTGFVQTYLVPPKVSDFERVGDDVAHWTGFWKNRLSRVLLVFILSNIGSSIGTFAAFGWLKDLL